MRERIRKSHEESSLTELEGGNKKKMRKQLKITAEVDGDEVGFQVYQSSGMTKIEIIGMLQVVLQEITSQLKDEIKIVKQ